MDATSASDMMTVLQYVDHFYATSWNHLLVYGSVAVGIVGVVIPIMLQLYQTGAMRHERSKIRAAIVDQVSKEFQEVLRQDKAVLEDKIAAATKLLEERLAGDRAGLEDRVRKTEADLRKRIAKASGTVYGLQAHMLVTQNLYKVAVQSAMDAIDNMVRGDDHLNLRRTLQVVTEHCLPYMTKADCVEIEEGVRGFSKIMAKIKEWDSHDDFTDAVNVATRAFKAANERLSPEGN